MGNHKALTSAVAAIASIATLGALAAPAFAVDAANGTYSPNGKSVAELAKHGAAQRIAAIGNKSAKNVVLFIGDGMGDSEITIARDYLKGANGHFDGLDAVGQPGALDDVQAGTGQYTTFSLGDGSKDSAVGKDGAGKLVANPNPGKLTPVTDSSASGSAWATGTKTYNNAVDVDIYGNPQLNLFELAKAAGKATGNVSTAEIQDATPTVCTPNDAWLGNRGASLKDMTKKALDLLNANPNGQKNGFLLQVEGASIDKQDHNANACGQIGETDDFDQAIAYAIKNVDLTNTLVIVTADHAHTSQVLNAQPAYALSTVLKSADGNNMVVSYGTAQEASTDAEGGCNGGDMEHTGTQLRIAASGPGAQRVIGLTDQTDNFYTIAGALGLATSPDEQNALSKDGTVKVARTQAGKYVANVDGFNGDALLSYELKDKDGAVVSKSDSSTPLSGVRVKPAQTTSIALDKMSEGAEYTLTVTGRQSGKVATVAIQAPAAGSADKKPGADKNGVIASGEVPDDSAVSGPLGATGTAVMAIAIAAVMLVAIAMLIKAARNARNN